MLVAMVVVVRVLVPALFLLLVPLTTTWAAGGLSVTTPNGGQKWTIGKKYAIKWRKGTGGTSVRISLTKSGRHYKWISKRTRNDGRYTWKIPTSVAAGSAYKIKIKSVKKKKVLDSSNRYFTIKKKKTGGGSGGLTGSRYAGQYDGTLNITGRILGQTVSDSISFRLIVGVDGLVTGSSPGFVADGWCEEGKPIYVRGRSFKSSSRIKCYFPATGNCVVVGKEKGVFSSSGMSYSGSANYYCDKFNFKAWVSAYLNRTTRFSSSPRTGTSFRASSKRGQGLLFSPGLVTKLMLK
jgi:hypothetical protein